MSIQNQKWICGGECEAPVIEKYINLSGIKNAEADICVLGFFEIYINNKKVSEDVLTPVCSQYEKVLGKNLLYPLNDKLSGSRVYYNHYNITQYLVNGKNKLEFYLGNGWYNQKLRLIEGDFSHGVPRLCFEITVEAEDGGKKIFVSDDTWNWQPSYIKFNNIFYGEKHDYTAENGSEYPKKVQYCEGTKSPLILQDCPSDKIIRKIVPKLLSCIGSKKIYDCGENITGWVSFESKKHTQKVVIRFAEELDGKGELDFSTTGYDENNGQMQKDEFVLSGIERVCRPKFTWHGFRYFEFDGEAADITVEVVHSDILKKADFHCDNKLLNWLFDCYVRSQLGNMHCGVVSDCPHRERLGYTGDTQNTADTALLVFDAGKLYRKIIQDIADTQDVNTGHIQHSAPFYGGGGGPGGWGCAIVRIPYDYYRHCGDKSVLKKYYPNMLKYIDYMRSRCENGLVTSEEKDDLCLGEWETENPIEIPPEFVNTYFLIKSLIIMKEIAGIINEPADKLDEYEKFHKSVLIDSFYDGDNHTYCSGVNAADAFAADIGIADEKCIEGIYKKYSKQKLDTGIFGTAILADVLFKNGFGDVVLKLLSAKGENTFYEHMQFGATTLWESWHTRCPGSHNHHMFGAVISSFFYHILGINFFGKIVIEPKSISRLNSASGSVRTQYGMVSVSFIRHDKRINFDIYCDSDAVFRYNNTDYPLQSGVHNVFKF